VSETQPELPICQCQNQLDTSVVALAIAQTGGPVCIANQSLYYSLVKVVIFGLVFSRVFQGIVNQSSLLFFLLSLSPKVDCIEKRSLGPLRA
jgi:hypothetical protein